MEPKSRARHSAIHQGERMSEQPKTIAGAVLRRCEEVKRTVDKRTYKAYLFGWADAFSVIKTLDYSNRLEIIQDIIEEELRKNA